MCMITVVIRDAIFTRSARAPTSTFPRFETWPEIYLASDIYYLPTCIISTQTVCLSIKFSPTRTITWADQYTCNACPLTSLNHTDSIHEYWLYIFLYLGHANSRVSKAAADRTMTLVYSLASFTLFFPSPCFKWYCFVFSRQWRKNFITINHAWPILGFFVFLWNSGFEAVEAAKKYLY